MGLTFNGTSVTAVNYNGTALSKISFNGTEVWQASAPFDGLCFTANTANSTISMSPAASSSLNPTFETSTNGVSWQIFIPGTTTITLANIGDKVYFRGNNPDGITDSLYYQYKFVMTGSIAASGNIMSIIDNGACTTLTIPNPYCFNNLFYGCTALTSAPDLPATTLKERCYYEMFRDCSNLVNIPARLPAMTVPAYCYYFMFGGCAITTAPVLPATTLNEGSYQFMFSGCGSLTTPPVLSATRLAKNCYRDMFGSSGLTTVPSLPATTLAEGCYAYMFENCCSLNYVPVLRATALATNCYRGMFYECRNLYIDAAQSSGSYTANWYLPSSGAFTNTYAQADMFLNCKYHSYKPSTTMAGVSGNRYTYHVDNTPIS